MTYDEFARVADDGARAVRVQRIGFDAVKGLAELDYGNRVTVRWENGEQSRCDIGDLELAGEPERCSDCGRTVRDCDLDYSGAGAPRPAFASVWASNLEPCADRTRRADD